MLDGVSDTLGYDVCSLQRYYVDATGVQGSCGQGVVVCGTLWSATTTRSWLWCSCFRVLIFNAINPTTICTVSAHSTPVLDAGEHIQSFSGGCQEYSKCTMSLSSLSASELRQLSVAHEGFADSVLRLLPWVKTCHVYNTSYARTVTLQRLGLVKVGGLIGRSSTSVLEG